LEIRDLRSKITWTLLLLVATMNPQMLAGEGDWEIARPDYEWSFPEDHWARDGYKTEWWYFTGHLEADDGQRFGYQFTLFRVGLLRERPGVESAWGAKDLIMGHAALSLLHSEQGRENEAGDSHRFSEVLYRASPMLAGFGTFPDSIIAWSRAPAGSDGKWELTWNGEAFDFSARDEGLGFAFSLSTRPTKPLIFQGPNGFSRKGEGASSASQYYSFTRLHTEGTILVDGQSHPVTGQSWMDKEFFTNSLADGQVGWDWFSLQLDDGRELMLYVMRNENGEIDYASGTLVEKDSQVSYLDREAFRINETDSWKSPSGDSYGSEWRVRIPEASLDLIVRSQLPDQENRSKLIPTLRYWEGAVDVTGKDGKKMGVGFVEMTGYGAASIPAM
jgi:predicted secreted hydrolase